MSRSVPARELARRVPFARQLYSRHLRGRVDGVVVSFPKAGRTWLRAMAGQMLASAHGLELGGFPDPLDVARLARSGPRLAFVHAGADRQRDYAQRRRLRVFKWLESRPVLFLARDPRDVVVSYYLHRTRRLSERHELSAFIRDADYGIDRVIDFMNLWDWNRDVPAAFRVLRYEDLLADPLRQLQQFGEFFGIPQLPERTLNAVIDGCSIERMRAYAETEIDDWRLRPSDAHDPASHKVRQGEVGGHVSVLSETDVRWANAQVRHRLCPAFGYGGAT